MNSFQIAAARRLMQSPHWNLHPPRRPRMATRDGVVSCRDDDTGVRWIDVAPDGADDFELVPDLDDPATLGVLQATVLYDLPGVVPEVRARPESCLADLTHVRWSGPLWKVLVNAIVAAPWVLVDASARRPDRRSRGGQ